MAYTTKAREYFRGVGATNDEIHGFFYYCSKFKDAGKKARYEVHRLSQDWRLYKTHIRFDFQDDLKWYLRNVTKGEVVDDDLPSDAIYVDSENFVKFVFRHLDGAL